MQDEMFMSPEFFGWSGEICHFWVRAIEGWRDEIFAMCSRLLRKYNIFNTTSLFLFVF